ncbi:MAG: stage 0 sporulation protein [Deltaproteobacteria bacterium]|nr:stage 0 sporulation protein [Deltaproteobacteria bacterium]MBW2660803.1 stage 0 sporulation protein [Deltaproteobacteria bacterium]
MKKIVKIRFKPTGKVYDFDSGAFVLKCGDRVIVETDQGLGLGTVVVPPKPFDEQQYGRLLKKVFRLFNEKDLCQWEKNCKVEKLAEAYCFKCIKKLKLIMHLFSVESSFDGSKLTFFFTSEGRVDFRKLVKMLIKELGVRIEMRQVGIRYKAKICSGMGRCGRVVCCSAFIEKFEPVSIRMAKNQNLSLNPTKISGLCGRLMCCLTFENETYKELKKKFPKTNKVVMTKKGKGKVLRNNVISNHLTIRLNDGQELEIGLDEIIQEHK